MHLRRLAVAATISLILTGCGKDQLPSDVLAYVPADTPYVMASQKPMTADVMNAWMGIYGDSMTKMYADLAESPEMEKIEGELGIWLRAALPEFAQLIGPDGAAKTGIDFTGRYALYGVDLLPVYRIEIRDAAKLEAMFGRIEKRAGKPMPLKTVGDHRLRQFANDQAQILLGNVGPYFVLTVAPANADEARLLALLGVTLPNESIVDSGALAELNQKMGYDSQISGYVDIANVFKRLSGQSATDLATITAFGGEAPKLSADCTQELQAIAQKMPRAVFGAREFTAKSMDFNTVIEIDHAQAKAMLPIAAPIPGGNANDPAMFRFAFSANIPEAVKYLGTIADAINAAPYKCDELKDLNDSAMELKSNLANPGLAMAGSVTAAHIGLTQLELESGAEMPTALSGFLAVGSPTPIMLWGLAQQTMPALSKVTLNADGSIVMLPDETIPAPVALKLKATMTDKVLAIATQDVSDRALGSLKEMSSGDGTVLRYSVTGDFFALFDKMIPEPPAEIGEAEAKNIENSRQMFKSFGENVDYVDVRVKLTERGIEFDQTGALK